MYCCGYVNLSQLKFFKPKFMTKYKYYLKDFKI